MSKHDEEDQNFTSTTQEKIKRGNFKALYNQTYGNFVGKNREFTPEQIYNLAVKYFTWAEENAIKAAETAAFQGIVTENLVHKPRVFTVKALRLFCGFSSMQLVEWRRAPMYCDVMEFIDDVIYEQKFQLAANGIVNASFIGKELGIDKAAEINVSASSEASAAAVTTEEFKDAVNDILGAL